VNQGQTLEQPFSFARDLNQDLAPIAAAWRSANKASIFQPVNQFNRAVMAQQEALGEIPDRGGGAGRDSPQGQQELVLRGIDSGVACRSLAEVEETTDLESKLRQRSVIRA
jgi:hypothetical protein